jgi:hypothetical protein
MAKQVEYIKYVHIMKAMVECLSLQCVKKCSVSSYRSHSSTYINYRYIYLTVYRDQNWRGGTLVPYTFFPCFFKISQMQVLYMNFSVTSLPI